MRSRFRIGDTEHEVWLSRREGGYRLHGVGIADGIEVALEACDDPPPAGGGVGREAADGGGTPHPEIARLTPLARAARVGPPLRGRDHRGEVAKPRVLHLAGSRSHVLVAVSGDDIHIHIDGRTHLVRFLDPVRSEAGGASAGGDDARAPMPGIVLAVHVRPGSAVSPGDALVAIESMKLETTIRATRAGTVEAVHVRDGQSFERDQVLVTMAKAG